MRVAGSYPRQVRPWCAVSARLAVTAKRAHEAHRPTSSVFAGSRERSQDAIRPFARRNRSWRRVPAALGGTINVTIAGNVRGSSSSVVAGPRDSSAPQHAHRRRQRPRTANSADEVTDRAMLTRHVACQMPRFEGWQVIMRVRVDSGR